MIIRLLPEEAPHPRLVAAFILAPLSLWAVAFILILLAQGSIWPLDMNGLETGTETVGRESVELTYNMEALWFTIVMSFIIFLVMAALAYPMVLLIGLPVYCLLNSRTQHELRYYFMTTVFFTVILAGLFELDMMRIVFALPMTVTLQTYALIWLSSFVAVSTFWLIARPDKNR